MRIVITGGGTGGHTTPLIAIGKALEELDQQVEVIAISEKTAEQSSLDNFSTSFVRAGKFRRYHGESLIDHIRDIKTIILNIRDVFKFIVGIAESIYLLRRIKPQIVFVKGGYVSLPVGLAAWMLGIPYVTHDSDSIPSLTNRILARGATLRLSGFPHQGSIVKHTGIPVRAEFDHVNYHLSREKLQVTSKEQYIVIVGGSLGAQAINTAVTNIAKELTKYAKITHVCGKIEYPKLRKHTKSLKNYQLFDYTALEHHFAAADVVVTRAGATTLAELASLHKAIIIIPNPALTGGHQLKNADIIREFDAGVVVEEAELARRPQVLIDEINQLLHDDNKRRWLGENLHKLFPRNASKAIAHEVLRLAKDQGQEVTQESD